MRIELKIDDISAVKKENDCDFPTAKTCLFDATKDRFVPIKNCFHSTRVACHGIELSSAARLQLW